MSLTSQMNSIATRLTFLWTHVNQPENNSKLKDCRLNAQQFRYVQGVYPLCKRSLCTRGYPGNVTLLTSKVIRYSCFTKIWGIFCCVCTKQQCTTGSVDGGVISNWISTINLNCNTLSVMHTEWTNVLKIISAHRGLVTHICASNLTIVGSDNGLLPTWRQYC